MNIHTILRDFWGNVEPDYETTDQELKTLTRLANKYMWSDVDTHRRLNDAGVIIEPARFYSQLPTISDIEESFEYQPDFEKEGPYFDLDLFDVDCMRNFMDASLSFAEEFDPPKDGNQVDPTQFFWRNPAFSFADAMAYWCQIRMKKPKKVIEIGSGFSTLIARDALEKNGYGDLVCIEPYPMEWMKQQFPNGRLIETPIQNWSSDDINDELSDGDILFIDSTHTVKIGSDCLWIYLKLLPALEHRIHIHVHDVFLPYAQPQKTALQKRINWVEPYLVLAYLTDNPRIKIEFGSMFASKFLPNETKTFMHERWSGSGGSLWFEQRPR